MTARLQGGKTGWPPGLLQDDDARLSRWFASRLGARFTVQKAIYRKETMPVIAWLLTNPQDGEVTVIYKEPSKYQLQYYRVQKVVIFSLGDAN